MSSYKLTYFAVRARAESTRLAFAFGGVQYEDIRLEMGSGEWSKMKEGKHLSVWWAVVITIGFFRSNFLQTSGIIPEWQKARLNWSRAHRGPHTGVCVTYIGNV